MQTLATVFLWLMIYSFIGWVYESTLCSITGHKLVNRGFLNGPICPVYGFGDDSLFCDAVDGHQFPAHCGTGSALSDSVYPCVYGGQISVSPCTRFCLVSQLL